jgi:hypothetical protein
LVGSFVSTPTRFVDLPPPLQPQPSVATSPLGALPYRSVQQAQGWAVAVVSHRLFF